MHNSDIYESLPLEYLNYMYITMSNIFIKIHTGIRKNIKMKIVDLDCDLKENNEWNIGNSIFPCSLKKKSKLKRHNKRFYLLPSRWFVKLQTVLRNDEISRIRISIQTWSWETFFGSRWTKKPKNRQNCQKTNQGSQK